MSAPTETHYDMGYTANEFANVLQGNFSGDKSPLNCIRQQNNNWLITHDDSTMKVEIITETRPPRILGAISLPVLSVNFKVSSATTEQSEFFFDKFFKYFHKGGG